MPFGKHKGKSLQQVPKQYLDWLIGNGDLREPMKGFLEREVARRENSGEADQTPATEHGSVSRGEPASDAAVRRIIRQELGLLFHRLGDALEKGRG
jgi:hypothetical protein